MARLVRGVRGLAIDWSPLRESRDYRRLLSGPLDSMIGRQLTIVAVPYQVYLLTRSSFAVGMIRRRLLLVALLLQGVPSGLLMAATLRGAPVLAFIYSITAGAAALQ